MTTYSWEFGAAGSGTYAVIFYDDATQTFAVNNVEGSLDLNAIWFSDGDKTAGEGGAKLAKADSSLNMNGTQITWDDYAKLSLPGLGASGENKSTFLSSGEVQTYTLADLQKKGLDASWITDWSKITLGLRATSASEPSDSVKLVDGAAATVITSDDVSHQLNFYGTVYSNYLQGDGATASGATMSIGAMAGETVDFGNQVIQLPSGEAYTVAYGDVMYAGAEHGGTINFGDDKIYGSAGTDYITGDTDADYDQSTYPGGGTYNFGDDTLVAGGGDDTVYGDARQLGNFPSLPDSGAPYQGTYVLGNDYVNGGDGADTLYGDIQQANSGNLTFGDDTVLGGTGDDYAIGDVDYLLAFSDPVTAVAGNDTVSGGSGDDYISGDATYVVSYYAGSSVDLVSGSDALNGGDGSDFLVGDVYEAAGDPMRWALAP